MKTSARNDKEAVIDFPELRSYSEYLSWYAKCTPDAPATWFEDSTLTYAELEGKVDRLARALLGNGVQAGDRVGVLSTPRPEFLVTLLATLRIGAVWVGLNPRYTYRELNHVVGDCRPALLLSIAAFEGREFVGDIARLCADHPSVKLAVCLDSTPQIGSLVPMEDFLARAGVVSDTLYQAAIDAVSGKDPAVIVYTSGTTGAPKGAVLPHIGLVYGMRTEACAMGIARPRVACNLPINHVACIGDVCGSTLISGGMIAFMVRFDPSQFLELIERLRLTSLTHVPTVLQILSMQPDFYTRDLSSLRLVGWGGAPLPVNVVRQYRRLGGRLMATYGMTETIGMVTWTNADADDETLATTAGRPDPSMQVRVMTEEGREAALGEPGEILVKHDALMLGYFGRPEATRAVFTEDGYLRTGDIGFFGEDGNLRLVGRRTEMYKSGGYNVYPREIEIFLEKHPGVALAAVIGVHNSLYGEIGIAFIVPNRGQPIDEDSLLIWCREGLANYKIPKQFIVREDLPRLPIGKVDKQALRREFGGRT